MLVMLHVSSYSITGVHNAVVGKSKKQTTLGSLSRMSQSKLFGEEQTSLHRSGSQTVVSVPCSRKLRTIVTCCFLLVVLQGSDSAGFDASRAPRPSSDAKALKL